MTPEGPHRNRRAAGAFCPPGPASPPDAVQVHERRISGARGETCLPLSCAPLYVDAERSPVPHMGEY